MKKLLPLVWMLFSASAVFAETQVFKLATLAPEGTSWMVIMREVANEVKAKTSERVELKLYPGGVAGDETDVLKKMRVGQYHAAGFTGVGLGEIVPEVRALELPFFYESPAELQYVREKLTPIYEQKFKEKGFIFMDWAEPGLVYILSQKPIQTVADMKGVKMWAWESDPLADALLHTFNIAPVRIALPDVLMGLQTSMINAVYGPPMAAMALQWQTKVKYMNAEPVTNSTGAVLLHKNIWEKVSKADQELVKSLLQKALRKLTESTIQQNNEAIEKFKQQGIQLVNSTKEGRAEMYAAASKIRTELVGKLYSAEFLKQVEGVVLEFRTKGAKATKGKKGKK